MVGFCQAEDASLQSDSIELLGGTLQLTQTLPVVGVGRPISSGGGSQGM